MTWKTPVFLCLLLGALNTWGAQGPWGPGTWEFKPGPDPFGKGSLLDLRDMNEKVAGESGFVRLSADGNDMVLGNGRPARFWAVGTDLFRKSGVEMDRHARFLAAIGVNMIRIHADIAPKDPAAPMDSIDEKELDGIFRMLAAAKKQGIYVTLSPFWPHHAIPASWNIEGYKDREGWGLFFFNPRLQQAYRAWMTALYSRKNPYTGLSLAEDPAVAVVQLMNEDSLLFWTSQEIQAPQNEILKKRFEAWLAKKYGKVPEAVQLLKVWDLTQPQTGERAKLAADQTQFFAELQFDFYRDMEKMLRKLGCKQLVNAMNWRPADPVRLYDAERWSMSANAVMAVNRYVTSLHIGENDGWRIDNGHQITDRSALLSPETFPTNLKQVDGHPFLVTESSWVQPMSYQAEGPFVVGAYQALSGLDAYYWFSATDATWNLDPRIMWTTVQGDHPLFKWSCSIPSLMGQFPAAALAYRRGYLRQAPQSVHEERALDDLWQRRIPLISEEGAYDPNRDKGAFAPASSIKQEIDRLAFLTGLVQVTYGGDPAKSRVADLTKFIRRDQSKVTSATQEIELDYGKGICKVSAPAFQGFAGFVGHAGGVVDLPDLRLTSANDYLACYFVSMDGLPLKSSRRILLQTGAVSHLSGWETIPSRFKADGVEQQGEKILHTGQPPWRIQNTELSFSLANPLLSKAVVLDVDGRPAKELALHIGKGRVELRLPPDTTYLILE
ncbi:MAG: hypothetical protein V4498_00045 [candidate division FCPU426 bacterium]